MQVIIHRLDQYASSGPNAQGLANAAWCLAFGVGALCLNPRPIVDYLVRGTAEVSVACYEVENNCNKNEIARSEVTSFSIVSNLVTVWQPGGNARHSARRGGGGGGSLSGSAECKTYTVIDCSTGVA